MHETACFVTLTYNDENVPHGGTVVKEDLQKFFKRLRKNVGQFRYYACGEYGDSSNRPHYHAVIFGLDFAFDRKKHSQNDRGDIIYTSQKLSDTWGLGHCLIGSFNYQTAAYVARYVMKKQTGKHAMDSDLYSRFDVYGEIFQVRPEFALMSRNPGLGSTWYEKFKSDAFPSDFLVYKGKKHTVPRYYYDKLQRENKPLQEKIRIKRSVARSLVATDNTSDRLAAKRECKLSQISKLSRSL
ncbi:hypothetical protein HGB07_06940 [Candidatus Roizmanbacteria bacterium]|nr:hypothetical protein [Candidatus Roizmanbacteria bacterium]